MVFKTIPQAVGFGHLRCYFFLSTDFNEKWHSMMITRLITEVERPWALLILGWVTDCVLGQVSHECDLKFVFVTRLL